MSNNLAGYATGVYTHVGSRFTQIGDQAVGFGTVNLLSFSPNNIGGPYTQNTFTFNPELPAYDIVNARIGVLRKYGLAMARQLIDFAGESEPEALAERQLQRGPIELLPRKRDVLVVIAP